VAKDTNQIDLITKVRDCLRRARDFQDRWRKEAEESDAFVAGHQWEDKDRNALNSNGKPAITYNRVAPTVNAVVGSEIQHRQKMIFIPRDPQNDEVAGMADLGTDAYEWVLKQCAGDYERTQAFRDSLIRGIGWMQIRMGFDDDLDGKVELVRVNGTEMFFDPEARMQNLEDAKWMARQQVMTLEDVKNTWPEKVEEVKLAAMTGTSIYGNEDQAEVSIPTVIVNHSPNGYAMGSQDIKAGTNANPDTQGGTRQKLVVTHYQWIEKQTVYRLPNYTVGLDGLDVEEAPRAPEFKAPEEGAMPKAAPGMPQVPPIPGMPPQAQAAMAKAAQSAMGGQQGAGSPPPPPMPGMAGPGGPGMAGPGGPGEMLPPPPPQEKSAKDELVTLSTEEFKKLKSRLEALGQEVPEHVRQTRNVYRRIFATGDIVLQNDTLPTRGFSFMPMTCFWDEKEKIHYGLVRAMKDPQRGANKYFSQGVHLFSVSPKGTMLAETGAFENPKSIAGDWAKPGSIIRLKPGAIAGGMVKVEPPPPFPEAATTMTKFALESLRDVTGVNLEMLGQSEGSEPGTAIQKRQSQAMTILAPIFSAYSRYREREAKSVIRYLRKFMTNGRWMRVGGAFNSEYYQLFKESFAEEYDLILDDAPSDPNQKMAVWENLQPLLPMLVRQGAFPIALLDYAPLPASVVSAVKREIQGKMKSGQQAPPPAEKNKNPEYIKAEIDAKRAAAELDRARAQALLQESKLDMATQAQTLILRQNDGEVRKRPGDDDSMDQNSNLSKLKNPLTPGVRGVA
jgi:hypothetical protein